MTARELIEKGDEALVDRAYFDAECPQFLSVDWGEEDSTIVEMCEELLETGKLSAEWGDDDGNLIIRYGEAEKMVPLAMDAGDRHLTICALNDILDPDYELRMIVSSHGSDTLGLCALPKGEWAALEKSRPAVVEANFLDPRRLPNMVTELRDADLPQLARERFERMITRNTRE